MKKGGEMARYKDYCYEQTKLIPISFHHQILPGTFEYTLNYLIDNEVDLSLFEQRYRNDETGAPNRQRGQVRSWLLTHLVKSTRRFLWLVRCASNTPEHTTIS